MFMKLRNINCRKNKIQKNKKAQGDIIAWVLLVGFAVSLAIIVGRWSLQQTEKSTESIVTTSEADIVCDSVALGAICKVTGETFIITVANKGALKIVDLNIGGCTQNKPLTPSTPFCVKKDGKYTSNDCINLNSQKDITVTGCVNTITMIPLVYSGDSIVGCAMKQINLKVDQCTINEENPYL